MIPVVTIADENFLPGLVALHNSFKRNSAEGFEFWAILRGSDEFVAHVRALGINVIVEPDFPIDHYPVSKRYPNEEPLFYWRLLVPELFTQDYSIYIDGDSLILQSLQPLVDAGTFGRPIAATRSNSPTGMEYGPAGSSEVRSANYGPMSSLYLFNRAVWKEQAVFDRCLEAMKSDMVFHTIVQGLVQYVLGNNWHKWAWQTQAHSHHNTMASAPRGQVYTLHFMGAKPWQDMPAERTITPAITSARALWKDYE